MLDKISLYHFKQREFQNISNQIQSTFQELEKLGLTIETYKTATAGYINYPPIEVGESVHIAERLIGNKRDREERKLKNT